MIPAIFVLLCVVFRNIDSENPTILMFDIDRRIDYTSFYFFLYAVEIALIAVALRTLYIKTGITAGSVAGAPVAFSARRNLRSLLLFSVAPSVMQIPFAVRQITGIAMSTESDCHTHCITIACQENCGRYALIL